MECPPPADALDGDGDVDQQILEALRSKDRIYVLKLGEQMESLIADRKARIDLTAATSYQRLLVHRCSAYYKLAPENDPLTKAISVVPTAESRIPARRLSDLVPPESTHAPAFKIMRRSPPSRAQSQPAPADDADLDAKSRLTIQQREAAYNEARSRIFMDFKESPASSASSVEPDPARNPASRSAHASARSSRAPSPSSFTYANIYEPNHTAYYDHPQPAYNHYMYPYPPPGIPYYAAYPYYQYPYPSPPSDPSTADPYTAGMYHPWSHPPPPMPHPPPGAPPPPIHHSPPQYPYVPPPHPYPYPMPAYYPITAESSSGHINAYDPSAAGQHRNGAGGTPSPGFKNSHRHNSVGSAGKARSTSINQGRGWSYGPGVGQGGHVVSPTDAIGPRLTNTRRTSSATSRSSNCDDVSSTASSSTTSSSSRQTFRSTASSQHPLPARPDWAVGLKPQPTLHSTQQRHREHSHSNSSPSRNINGNGNGYHHHPNTDNTTAQQQPASLQSPTEFPPLSSGSGVAPERRVPVVSGAWGNNASAARNIRLMSPGQGPQPHSALVHHPQPLVSSSVQSLMMDGAEDSDRAFERPPPKSVELFNPKVLKRPGNAPGKQQEKERDNQKERGGDGPSRVGVQLVSEQVEAMSLDGAGVEPQPKEALAV
ncbi:hypothetical protein H2248_010742 [Termitomyces sp. 'cryptogamus']|nr:hypothetical protein H2248_010742 [Termitomyces sp. 'cryptogamus']